MHLSKVATFRPVILTVLTLALFCLNALELSAQVRTRKNFDQGWHFILGDPDNAQKNDFIISDPTQWRLLDLPHDWAVEGPFDQKAPSGASGGYLPGGIGWYRKTFMVDQKENQQTTIEFDGVYKNSEVWINGHSLGKRPNGYLGFEYDLTPYLKNEGKNVIAVRVDNSLQPSSRWYTGSGIYRHVWLKQTDKVHVTHWGVQVTTPDISQTQAKVVVRTTVENRYADAKEIAVTHRGSWIDKGQAVELKSVTVDAAKTGDVSHELKIDNPKLWSPDSPHLYSITTELSVDNRVVDRYVTTFGVRELKFDPDKGLFLNGESIIMKGMCNHDDLGPLGAAFWDDALRRRLQMLKEMGCNAIRTAHNPPAPELLDMCDQMGFLVIDETFDKWRFGWKFSEGRLIANREKPAVRYGYHLHIDQWWQRDLGDHIKRDRNHPSVILWSVANEVPEAQKDGENETVKKMRELCHQLDPSRPVTAGVNLISGANETGFPEQLDAVGYNGGGGSCFQYEEDHLRFPKRFIYASEVPHSLQTRGEYRTKSKYREKKHQPADLTTEEVFPETHPKYESSYDNAGVRISAQDSWRLTKTLPYVAGEFRWTGFDYIGESGGWPRVLGNFGIIDLGNFPKDTFYFYQSQWTDKPMVHLLPHWTWPEKEGTEIPVWCYSNGDRVELFLNGESLGAKKFGGENDMHLQWMVPYQKGELKAVAYRDGKVVAQTIQKTAQAAAKFDFISDRQTVDANKRELAFIKVAIKDADDTFVPKAAINIQLKIEGPGRILAVCNGDPMDSGGFQRDSITTFNGLARVIVAPTGDAGTIVITASSENLPSVTTQIQVK